MTDGLKGGPSNLVKASDQLTLSDGWLGAFFYLQHSFLHEAIYFRLSQVRGMVHTIFSSSDWNLLDACWICSSDSLESRLGNNH
jgi:hypothetical protein